MTPEKLLEAIGDIDDSFIEESAGRRRKFFGGNWGLVASAACLCLLIGGVIFLHNAGWMPYFPGPTQNTEPPVTTTDPTETTQPTQPLMRPSVEEFFADRDNWQNHVILVSFSEPGDVHIPYLFSRPIDGESTEPTELERELLPELMERYDPLLLFRATKEQMDEVLLAYFNITTDQLAPDWENGFTYLEETGCYYTLVSRNNGYHVSIDRTEECDDGTVLMYYTLGNNPDAEPDMVARLQPHDTGYYLLSNEKYVDNTGKTEEQVFFEQMFGDYQSWYNRALTCEFDNPVQLKLLSFFYCGFPDESRRPTAEEWEQLKDRQGFNENYDLMRLPEHKMDQVLREYFGITLDDIPAEGFAGLTYLESTDCWYFMTTGWLGVESIRALTVEELDNGTVRVRYDADYWGIFNVTLRLYGDGYNILSNQKIQ